MMLPCHRPNGSVRTTRRRVALAVAVAATLVTGACSGSTSDSSKTTVPTTGSWPSSAPCRSGASEDHDLVVPSKVYRSDDRVTVHVTPCVEATGRSVPVLYLLHGSGNDEHQWSDVGVLQAADRAVATGVFPPSVIVIPDAQGAYGCSDCEADLTTHLLTEIEPKLAAFADINPARRAIGGISAGGGLALTVAARHPEDFVAVGGHSPVSVGASDLDVLADRMAVYLDVGRDDAFVGSTEKMAQELEHRGAVVELAVNSGGHKDPYWNEHVADYLEFYGRYLG